MTQVIYKKRYFFIFLIATFFIVFLTSSFAEASTPADGATFDNIYNIYKNMGQSWVQTFQTAGTRIFWFLATISFTWQIGSIAMRHEGIDAILAFMVRFMIMTGLFWMFLKHAPSIAKAIVATMESLGQKQLTGDIVSSTGDISPKFFLDLGFALLKPFKDSVSWSAGFIAFFIGIANLIIISLIAVNYLLMVASTWVVVYAGIFFLGFGGASFTSDIAINYFRNVLGLATQLMVMMLLLGIGQQFLTNAVRIESISDILAIFVSMIVLFVLTNKLPSIVAGIIFNSSLGSQPIGSAGEVAKVGIVSGATSVAVATKAIKPFIRR